MNLHVAPLSTRVWNDYCAMWDVRGGSVKGRPQPGIYVQTDDGVLVGGIQCFPTDGEWLFVEHLAMAEGLSREVAEEVVRYMIQVCKGYATVLAKNVIILNGVAWCGALLSSGGFERRAETPFIFAPKPLPLRPATDDQRVAVLLAELARAKEQLSGRRHSLEEGTAESRQAADARQRRERYDDEVGTRVPVMDVEAVVDAGRKVLEEIIDDPGPQAGSESFAGTDNEAESAKTLGMTLPEYREMVSMAQAKVAPDPKPKKKASGKKKASKK